MIPGIVAGAKRQINSDPHFANVELLLHMDGSNGSTTFVDSSSRARTIIAGASTISTAQSRFGGSSCLIPSNPGGATMKELSGWGLGSGDFTIEMFIYGRPTLGSPLVGLVSWGGAYSYSFYWQINDTNFFSNGSGFVPHGLVDGQWNHIAITRASGSMRYFVNGAQVGSTWSRTTNYIGVVNRPTIGTHDASTQGLGTHIDELRITKGVARYTENFTPPTAPFPDTGPTP